MPFLRKEGPDSQSPLERVQGPFPAAGGAGVPATADRATVPSFRQLLGSRSPLEPSQCTLPSPERPGVLALAGASAGSPPSAKGPGVPFFAQRALGLFHVPIKVQIADHAGAGPSVYQKDWCTGLHWKRHKVPSRRQVGPWSWHLLEHAESCPPHGRFEVQLAAEAGPGSPPSSRQS